jgi:hypothetical protein
MHSRLARLELLGLEIRISDLVRDYRIMSKTINARLNPVMLEVVENFTICSTYHQTLKQTWDIVVKGFQKCSASL